MKRLNLLVLTLFVNFVLVAQAAGNNVSIDNNKTFEFYKQLDNANEVNVVESFIPNNFLGDEIARKYYILQELYTYEEEGSPTSPGTKTIVEKPNIYYAIKKLNRHYKKMVKKDKLSLEEAVEDFGHFLNIGISIVYQPTKKFEEYLDNLKKPEELISAFATVDLQD